jgi:predicted ATPase
VKKAASASATPLRRIEVEIPAEGKNGYPFDLPALAGLGPLALSRPVTVLVGENGSGKSTFVEALAWAAESVAAGSEALPLDTTLEHVRPLGQALRLTWNHRSRRGFFLRAEDFFGYVKRTRWTLAELQAEVRRVRTEFADLPEVELARRTSPYTREIAELQASYGKDMDAASHGEQFLRFFQRRLVPGGLYLLDEPEAPLSPMRQLAFLAILKDAVGNGSQFVIATHSPILMAFPDAEILSFDRAPLGPVEYADLEHVQLMRDFLNRPEAFLRHL